MALTPLQIKRRIRWGLFFFATAMLAYILLMPYNGRPVFVERLYQYKYHLKLIAYALHEYHDHYNVFPPAYTVDESGKPLHSWRTLILPYLGDTEKELYNRIDLSRPWDATENLSAREASVEVYRCLVGHEKPNRTPCLGIAVPHGLFASAEAISLKSITRGSFQTVALMVVPATSSVEWMSPYDANEIRIAHTILEGSVPQRNMFVYAMADGTRWFVNGPEDLSHFLAGLRYDDPFRDDSW